MAISEGMRRAAPALLGSGALVLAVSASASADQAESKPGRGAPGTPPAAASTSVVALIQPVELLQADLRVLDGPPEEADKPERPEEPEYVHRTGDLPRGMAVPLHDFRVGPLYGRVGGPHTGGVHSGLDLGAGMGEPVYSVSEGKVEVAAWQGAAGQAVTIVTAGGKRILYGHLSRMNVEAGQKVEAGDRIGAVGSTGNSTGPHLHLGVNRPNGSTMDPLIWLDVSAGALAEFGRD